MRRHHRDLEILSEMNLTNMLDTAFILLLAFMLVAPLIKHGIDLELPKVAQGPMQTQQDTITIVIAKSPAEGLGERIYIDDQRVDLEDIAGILEERRDLNPNLDIVLEADKSSSYGIIAQVLSLLKNRGFENIGLVTEPVEIDK